MIGDSTGTLGFADEIVAIVSSPLAGILSDRVGVRLVSSLAFLIIGCALFLTVQVRNVYPDLILARMLFGLGGATASCMITAILPTVSADTSSKRSNLQGSVTTSESVHDEHSATSDGRNGCRSPGRPGTPTGVAAVVGLVSGIGALLALFLFLRLPAAFEDAGFDAMQAVRNTYYITTALALLISITCFWGLRHVESKDEGLESNDHHAAKRASRASKHWKRWSLCRPILFGLQGGSLGLAFLGGFVARASSVCIATFVPLAINYGFVLTRKCTVDTRDRFDVKENCRAAFVISSQLTGISQTAGLICALALGYTSKVSLRPGLLLGFGAGLGIFGFALTGLQLSSLVEPPTVTANLVVIMVTLGVSQTVALVSSLGTLGQCVMDSQDDEDLWPRDRGDEQTPLQSQSSAATHEEFKGEIAGFYNLTGGLGILCLTKLGGFLFDEVSVAAPFLMLAIFNGFLFIACLISVPLSSNKLRTTRGGQAPVTEHL